jgi:hypothetical protein
MINYNFKVDYEINRKNLTQFKNIEYCDRVKQI